MRIFLLPLVANALRLDPAALGGSRRAVLAAATGAAFSTVLPATAAGPDYAGAKAELKSMIAADQDLGPTMVRLAWHSLHDLEPRAA